MTPKEQIRLLPCPFCGSPAYDFNPDGDMEGYHVGCSGKTILFGADESCCPMNSFSFPKYEDAVTAWNTRALAATAVSNQVGAGEREETVKIDAIEWLKGALVGEDGRFILSAEFIIANLRAISKSRPQENEVAIGGSGFFAGIKVQIDPSLPPDTVEMRGANRVRLNLATGECAASPIPSHAVEQAGCGVTDERKAFEQWYEADAMPQESDWFRKHDDGEYEGYAVAAGWDAWQARALLASRPAQARPLTDALIMDLELTIAMSGAIYPERAEAISKRLAEYRAEQSRPADEPSLRNWDEDFTHENGNYENNCFSCGMRFIGHKRRGFCKACSGKPIEPAAPLPEAGRDE